MKITAIDATPYRLPVRRDFAWAGLNVGIGRFVLVRVQTDDGLIGVGEAAPLAEWGGDHNRRGGETQWTVGVDPPRDQQLIRGLRERLGPDVGLRLDANQGYGTVAGAVRILRGIEPFGLDFVEQPVAGVRRLAQVRRAVGIPLIADESCWDAEDAMECAQSEAVDAISIYLAKAGGIAGARRVATVAHAAGLPCDVNGSIE